MVADDPAAAGAQLECFHDPADANWQGASSRIGENALYRVWS